MLILFTVLIVGAVAYAYLGEGLIQASLMCINVLIAGLVAFNFWEPLADLIEEQVSGSDFATYVDALCLLGLFCLTLGLLRLVTNTLQPLQIDIHGAVQSAGGAFFGAIIGYLVAGFLLCVFQTLPLAVDFLGFDPNYQPGQGLRTYLPPDRVWLGLMQYASSHAFNVDADEDTQPAPLAKDLANPDLDESRTFDKYSTFELRYARYRRYAGGRDPLDYDHEFDAELQRSGG
ncbi:MAG TPA: CvpA family protein [Gemmataceae bacterium]|nr:CvpA family protein [Gemmataceae bacterium]